MYCTLGHTRSGKQVFQEYLSITRAELGVKDAGIGAVGRYVGR